MSYGLEHSITPKRIPTETIVSSVEAVLANQRDGIRSKVASTLQSSSIRDNNLTTDEKHALKTTKTSCQINSAKKRPLEEYNDLFHGLGKLKDFKVQMHVDESRTTCGTIA